MESPINREKLEALRDRLGSYPASRLAYHLKMSLQGVYRIIRNPNYGYTARSRVTAREFNRVLDIVEREAAEK